MTHIFNLNHTPELAADNIQRIGYESYVGSEWLRNIATAVNVPVEYLASEVFDPNDKQKLAYTKERVISSKDPANESTCLFAAASQSSTPEGFIVVRPEPIYVEYEEDEKPNIDDLGYNPNVANILNLCVSPSAQREGVARELLYQALLLHPRKELAVSLFTPKANLAMQGLAKSVGFYRDNLDGLVGRFGKDIDIPYVRYEGIISSVIHIIEDECD